MTVVTTGNIMGKVVATESANTRKALRKNVSTATPTRKKRKVSIYGEGKKELVTTKPGKR